MTWILSTLLYWTSAHPLNYRDLQPLICLLLGLWKAFIWTLLIFLVWIMSCSLFSGEKTQCYMNSALIYLEHVQRQTLCHSFETATL